MACTHLLLSLLYQKNEEIDTEVQFFFKSNIFIPSRDISAQAAPAGNVTGVDKFNNVPETFISFVSYW